MKVGLPVCSLPWISVVSAGSAVGTTGVTVGVYLAVTGVPFLSTRLTVTPVPLPVKFFSGVNVTVPSGATVYVPSPGITFSFEPSSKVAGVSSSIGTFGLPGVKVGFPVCSLPWMSVVSAGSAVGTTGVTVGVYVAVVGVPFASLAWTVAGTGVPTKSLLGVNVTLPVVGSIVYVPTSFPLASFAGIVVSSVGCPVAGSINLAGWVASIIIGTLSLPGVNVGVPSWGCPCAPSDVVGVPVGSTGVIFGV